ncbi:hypothetical protein [Limnoglobus roseus]|uniref:Uncharacterized protein n=1 Tax=Limnoglobus roseus TaxID=2598579 RepID=A0A5C1A5U8_9BACT|nr:hypothetical protein [Limnoglobus roseus]QEL13725.1 hypothetical protein PX52LOC_00583 [Limnoglobus roseus]
MIALDKLRSALVSPQPWSALDRLVRAELSQGRLTRQIREELIGMEEQARDTPGFNDDSEEALHDIIDALAGICPAQYAYQNPPVLPTEEEIAELPLRAQLALAVRCSDIVFPLSQVDTRGNPPIKREACRLAFETLTQNLSAPLPNDFAVAPKLVEAISMEAFEQVNEVTQENGEILTIHSGGHVINASSKVLSTAMFALRSIVQGNAEELSSHVKTCLDLVANATLRYGDFKPYLRRIFDDLMRVSETLGWSDDALVSLDVFGPKFRAMPPRDWPQDMGHTSHSCVPIDLAQNQDIGERELIEETLNIFNALNEYHISRGGQPLTLNDLQPFIPALVRVGV